MDFDQFDGFRPYDAQFGRYWPFRRSDARCGRYSPIRPDDTCFGHFDLVIPVFAHLSNPTWRCSSWLILVVSWHCNPVIPVLAHLTRGCPFVEYAIFRHYTSDYIGGILFSGWSHFTVAAASLRPLLLRLAPCSQSIFWFPNRYLIILIMNNEIHFAFKYETVPPRGRHRVLVAEYIFYMQHALLQYSIYCNILWKINIHRILYPKNVQQNSTFMGSLNADLSSLLSNRGNYCKHDCVRVIVRMTVFVILRCLQNGVTLQGWKSWPKI